MDKYTQHFESESGALVYEPAFRVIHYSDVIMSTVASLITGVSVIYSTVCSPADQRKYQSSALLPFVKEIHRWSVNSLHKGPVTRKIFPFFDVIMGRTVSTASQWQWSLKFTIAPQIIDNSIILFSSVVGLAAKKTSQHRITGLVVKGIHRLAISGPHKGPVISCWNPVKKLKVLMLLISNHKHKIEEKSTKSSQSSSKVVGIGLVDWCEFPTLPVMRTVCPYHVVVMRS